MTKQEEIQEGIKGMLLFDMKLVSPMVSKELEYNANELARAILAYLDSEGVVIKVERELPDKNVNHTWYKDEFGEAGKIGYDLAVKDMCDADYVAVEPLIES